MPKCPCQTAPLSEYIIVIYEHPEEAPADFIKKYGMWPLEAERFKSFDDFDAKHDLPRTKVYTRIKSFTIAEGFKFIENKAGVAKPIHRVMELRNGEWHEVIACSKVKDRATIDREIAVLKQAGLWKE